jgi:ribonuclease P protein component
VRRNRMKRLLREFFRLHKALFLPGVDYSVVVKRNCSLNTFNDVVRELTPLLLRMRKSGNFKQKVSTC